MMRFGLGVLCFVLACSGMCGSEEKNEREAPTIAASSTLLERDGMLNGAGAASRASFDVPVTAGAHLSVVLTSDAFDPVLEVTPPGAGALTNDDWQGSRTESRIDVVPAEAGVMKVSVSGVDGDATGAFRLRVAQAGATGADGPVATNRLIAVGATLEGEIDQSDPALPDGRFQQSFLAAGADAGPVDLRIEARGGATPLAIVMDSQGRSLAPASDGVYHITEPGPHRVQLIAPTIGEVAGFRMSSTQAQAGATSVPTLSRNHHQLPTQPATEVIALGQNVQGTLAAGDGSLPTGEPADLFRFSGQTGQVTRIELRSDTFDTYLMVVGPTGRYWENDDTGGTTNSAIDLELPATGDYRIVASAYRAGMTGAYELKVNARTGATGVVANTNTANTAGAVTRTGALATGDPTLDSGELVDRYNFTWPAGAAFDVRVTSTEFDTYVIVREPGGEQHDNDDEADGNTNSYLRVDTTAAGAYQVLVTSYEPGLSGNYQLQITPAGAVAANPTPPSTPSAEGRRVISGELAQGDQTLRSGEFVDVHPLQLRAGQTVHLEARSSAFDTYLIVREPGGEQHDNDDGPGGGTNAALDFVASAAGDYRVSVTSYRAGEAGAYELIVAEQAHGATPTPPSTPNTPEPTVASGDAVNGALAQGDTTLSSGEFADAFSRTFTAGQSVQIRLSSTAFDPYLIVRTPSGRQLDNDDLTPSTRNAGIDIPSAEAGQYRLTATSYEAGETGAYQMTFGAGQAIPTATGGGSGSRVFGLFAGITDYPAGVGDLPECANDAIKLAEALRESGLLDESRQVVLTDAQASQANVRSALQRLGSQMGPEDIFVFFYSGHGGQTQNTSDPREIDGTDEYLVLHDGPLLDNDLGALFDSSIRARVSVVALDACFSGGFAKDLITRPGRVGFFSSEEDVLSAVAGQFQAGGYLSHFIRLAVSGEADMSPRDRVLTVGELSHFLYTQFGRHATDVQLQGAYQHLVVDRGAVHGDQVLWSYR